jgi:hypothetical protein
VVVDHLQVTLALGEADDLRVGPIEPELRRIQHRQQRLVVGEDADRTDHGPGRHHLDFLVEHLALGGEDLDSEFGVRHAPLLLVAGGGLGLGACDGLGLV